MTTTLLYTYTMDPKLSDLTIQQALLDHYSALLRLAHFALKDPTGFEVATGGDGAKEDLIQEIEKVLNK